MVRAPTIRGRPTPARKHKTIPSSSSSSLSKSASSTAKTVIPKALKRAEKRARLLDKASEAEENQSARALLNKGEHSISKSSLRRRKRKARDEIGKSIEEGRKGGVGELKDAVEDLEMELKGEEDDEEEEHGREGVTQPMHSKIAPTSQGGKVTTSQRKRVLAQEQARQGIILSDPAFKASPFEALRTHLRNSMTPSRK